MTPAERAEIEEQCRVLIANFREEQAKAKQHPYGSVERAHYQALAEEQFQRAARLRDRLRGAA